ncbi:prepilin peptidase [Candidatus Kaiserbacteria bacterium]|nr:prepilin peptidase [Candidatus Kaiserbacteria bacterium]
MKIRMEIIFFVIGAIIASFAGVVSERLHTGQGFLTGRSSCNACNAPLSTFALIPIVSYFISHGRSLCCEARISARAPVTEILLGALFVLSYLNLGITVALPFFLISLSALLALVLYDLAHQILPPSLLAVFIAASAAARFFISASISDLFSSLAAALLIALFLALIHFASSGRAMGLADAPLAFGLSLLAGPNAFSGFIFSFWIGAVIGITLLLRRPRGSRMGVEVPFAPYLAAGFLLAYFTQWNIFALVRGSLL